MVISAAVLLATVCPAAGQTVPGITLRGDCQTRLQEYLSKGNASHFFYAEDAESRKYGCGFSFTEAGTFERYPSAAQVAFTACQNAADEKGIKGRCELLARGPTVLARPGGESRAQDETADLVRDAMRCGQNPLNRWFWIERAFCDMPWHGPATAAGMVIWNHGIHSTVPQHTAPVPPVLRLLQARGWDVVKVARNNLGERGAEQSLYRAVKRTQEELATRRQEGYARVVLAGQSFGGYITLDAAESTRDVYGVIAMAPGVRAIGGAGSLDASVTERSLGRLSVDRLVLVLPRGDTLFGSRERGVGAAKVLARRGGSYLLLDETHDVVEHGGGTTGKFAVMYGPCVVRYLTTAEPGKGPARCEQSVRDQQEAVKALLPRLPATIRLAPPPAGTVGADPSASARQWYGILEPSGELVSFAIADTERVGPRAMFSVASGWRRGGLYAFSAAEAGVSFRVAERGTITVKGGTLTWTPAGGGDPQKARLFPLFDE